MPCWWSGVRWWVGMCKQPLARLSNNRSNCSATGKKLAWTESRERFFCVVAMWVCGDESQTQYGTCVLCACILIFVAFHGTLNSRVSGCLMHSNWFQQMKSVVKRGARWAASSFIKKRREGYSVAFEGSEAIPFSPIHFCAAFDLPEFAEGSSPPLPQLSRDICWPT